MTPNLLFQIFNWTWIIASILGTAASSVEALRKYQQVIKQIEWLALGGAFFYCVLFFTQSW